MSIRSSELPEFKQRTPVKEARDLFSEYLRMREAYSSPKSATAGHLEAIWLGSMGVVRDRQSSAWKNAQAGESLRMRFARLSILWGQLTAEEQAVIELQNAPMESTAANAVRCSCPKKKSDPGGWHPLNAVRPPQPKRTRMLCTFCRQGGGAHLVDNAVTIRTTVSESDLNVVDFDVQLVEPGVRMKASLTRGGAERVGPALAPEPLQRAVDDSGQRETTFSVALSPRVVVDTRLAPKRTLLDIAEEFGVTQHRVRDLVSSANRKAFHAALSWREEESE